MAEGDLERLDWSQFLIDIYTLIDKLPEKTAGVSAVFGNNDSGIIPAY